MTLEEAAKLQKRAIRDLCIKYGIVENLNERN
jgi:hypothetical protein